MLTGSVPTVRFNMNKDKYSRDPLAPGEEPPDPTEYQTLPSPFDDLIGLEVYTPHQGRGWVGFDHTDDGVAFWYVKNDTRMRILYDRILRYSDPTTGNIWMVFAHEGMSLIILLNPEDSFGAESYVPPAVREYIVAST
jgi:hypothetical protein